MHRFKKLVAALMVSVMCMSFASCANTDNAMQIGEKQIPAGLYIIYQNNALAEAQKHEDFDTEKDYTKESVWDNTLDDMSAVDWVNKKTIELVKETIVIDQMFEELGLSITEDDKEKLDYNLSGWDQNKDAYEKIGVGLSSYKIFLENNLKYTKVFEKYYDAVDGKEPISDESLKSHFKSEFAQFKSIRFSTLNAETGEAMTADEKKVVEEEVNTYLEKAKDTDNFDKLIEEKAVADAKAKEEEAPTFEDDADYMQTIKKGEDSYYVSAKVSEAIFEDVKVDEPTIVNDENAMYVVLKYDVEKNTEYFTEMRRQLLYDLKQEDFDKSVEEKIVDVEATLNDSAIKRYSPKNLTKK